MVSISANNIVPINSFIFWRNSLISWAKVGQNVSWIQELQTIVVFLTFGIGYHPKMIDMDVYCQQIPPCFTEPSSNILWQQSSGSQHPWMESSLPPRGKLPTFETHGNTPVVLIGWLYQELNNRVVFLTFGIGCHSEMTNTVCITSKYHPVCTESSTNNLWQQSSYSQQPLTESSLLPREKLPTSNDPPWSPWDCPMVSCMSIAFLANCFQWCLLQLWAAAVMGCCRHQLLWLLQSSAAAIDGVVVAVAGFCSCRLL